MKKESEKFFDIRHPKKRSERIFFSVPQREAITPPPLPFVPLKTARPILQKIGIGFAILAVSLTTVGVIGFFDLRASAKSALPRIERGFQTARDALTNLETGKATYAFKGVKKEIDTLQSKANRYGLGAISSLFSQAVPALKGIPVVFKNAGILTASLIELTGNLEDTSRNAASWLMHQDGGKLIEKLAGIQKALQQITEANTALKNQTNKLGYEPGNELLGANVELYRVEQFLDSLLGWLSENRLRHIAIFFQNPSEMRPAGGFLGSFGDLTLSADGVQEIKVTDVYDPDGQLDVNYLPPRELRGITPRWGARDANWFFDFPLSAEKTLSLLEQSKVYKEKTTTFDGAIALNIYVLGSILDIVGPMKIDGYSFTITKENFLSEIQREVESGADNKAGEPKRILKLLAPKLIAAIGTLNDEGKRALLQKLREHLTAKDIMVYMRDVPIEEYFKSTNIAGAIATLPEDSPSEYLAVASANVGGGKSDIFLSQSIKLSNKIDADGRISNFLTIERTHQGKNKKDPWYKATNKSYIKIFTPLRSTLEFMEGGTARSIPALSSSQSKFLKDQDLSTIEGSTIPHKEFGASELTESQKTVFSTWMNVAAGDDKTIKIHYTNPKKINLGADTVPYLFVFDKQSGSLSSLDVLFEAPPGYVWKESGSNLLNYVMDVLPARVSIELTLLRDQTAAETPL